MRGPQPPARQAAADPPGRYQRHQQVTHITNYILVPLCLVILMVIKRDIVPSRSVLCLLENFPHLVNIDSSLMEKFLLSMQNLFHESSGTIHTDMENDDKCSHQKAWSPLWRVTSCGP